MADRYRDYGEGERGFLERFADEVRSWFGDEEAQRRRMRDEREDWRGRGDWGSREWSHRDWRRGEARGDWDRGDRGRSSRGEWSRGPDDREWSRDWGLVEGRGHGLGYGGYDTMGYGAWGRERDWDRENRGRGSGPSFRDWSTGTFTGRGPRNYQRSDERIREDVCERLTQHSHLDPSDVDIRVQNGEVTLEGTVNDRWSKRTAEDLAEGVWGVNVVHNMLRIVSTEPQEARGDDQRRPGQQEPGHPQRGTWAA
jgi:osmotically-inducible protein OsmY